MFKSKISPPAHFSLLLLAVVTLAQLFSTPQLFAANTMLMMNPVRVIFPDRQRTVTVSVSNPTNQSVSYAISLVTVRKNQKGEYYRPEVETKEEELARSMIRYSPRRATIEPKKRQLVKLMVRKPKDLPVGEYQTRLELKPLNKPVQESSNSINGTAGTLINLNVIVVSTFPVIIQHGDVFGKVMPQSLKVKPYTKSPSGIAAEVTLSREGIGSGFGDVVLYYYPSKGRSKEIIGSSKGAAFYAPDTSHTINIPLRNITRKDLNSGTIQAVYTPSTGYDAAKLPRNLSPQSKKFTLPLR